MKAELAIGPLDRARSQRPLFVQSRGAERLARPRSLEWDESEGHTAGA